jgi:hypothetical protein
LVTFIPSTTKEKPFMSSNDPRRVSTAGLNQHLAAAVALIRDVILSAPGTNRAYRAGDLLNTLVAHLPQIQSESTYEYE